MNPPDPIPVVVCIDVEPDARLLDPGVRSPWSGFEQTTALLEEFRQQINGNNPAQFSWFLRMDPQIEMIYGSASWIAETHGLIVQRLRDAGDEMGLHVHAMRWSAPERAWVNDYADAAWIEQCLTTGFTAFQSSIGQRCRCFRFGDRWMDQPTLERLEALGVQIDLTLEPGHDDRSFYGSDERFTGVLPDYRVVPVAAYRPAANDYRVADVGKNAAIWELPVTTAPIQPRLAYRLYRRWLTRRPPTAAVTGLLSVEPGLFRRIIDTALARSDRHLVLPLRTGASTSRRYAQRIRTNLEALERHPAAARLAWVTPRVAIELLQDLAARHPTTHDGHRSPAGRTTSATP